MKQFVHLLALVKDLHLCLVFRVQFGRHQARQNEIKRSGIVPVLYAEHSPQIHIFSHGVRAVRRLGPVEEDSEIWESIRDLEETFSRLPNRCIQRVLREIDNMDLAVCIYVIEQDTRKKILANISTALSNAIMEDVALCASVSEKEVAARVTKVMHTVSTLQEAGEILVPAPESPLQKT